MSNRRKTILIILSLVCFILVVNANAALVDNGNGTITDTDTGLMWLQNANLAATSGGYSGRMTWSDAMTWANNLVFSGYDDWRLPWADTSCGINFHCTSSEMGHLYFIEGITMSNKGPFNIVDYSFWTGSTDNIPNKYSDVWIQVYLNGLQTVDYKSAPEFTPWAVRNNVVVPEPISSILFVTGGALLAGRSLIRKKA